MSVPPDDATLRAEAELRASMDVAMLRARVRELGTENTTLRDRIATLEAALIEATARANYYETGNPLDWEDVVHAESIVPNQTLRERFIALARAELVAVGLLAE